MRNNPAGRHNNRGAGDSMTEYDDVLRGEFINFYRPVNTPAPLA
ncbi:hypothetical protein HMPREF0742_02154 [Rothia aeria F0184]|uniref:Uncharacterized protein n=1 Tax=Rothia aeria F0184 TaxID=888019 RepID=U7V0V4_9MICC|nr:hypothetical protein HMPREF0742_02154 [Rothia aeria F0184]